MKKWEYLVVDLCGLDTGKSIYDYNEMLDHYGNDGWELVSVSGDIHVSIGNTGGWIDSTAAFFKRDK